MSASYKDYLARCPFFGSTDKVKVKCTEGPAKGSWIHVVFQGKKRMQRHLDKFCNRNYEGCPVYKMLVQKYEEEQK